MKYLKSFKNHAEYVAYIQGGGTPIERLIPATFIEQPSYDPEIILWEFAMRNGKLIQDERDYIDIKIPCDCEMLLLVMVVDEDYTVVASIFNVNFPALSEVIRFLRQDGDYNVYRVEVGMIGDIGARVATCAANVPTELAYAWEGSVWIRVSDSNPMTDWEGIETIDTYKISPGKITLPNVSICTNASHVHYNPCESQPDNEIWYTTFSENLCTKFESAYFGDGVELISNTYENGKGIAKFNAPVTCIGDQALGYQDIITIELPNTVTRFGYGAFDYNEYLTEITIPENLEYIDGDVFSGCPSLPRDNGVIVYAGIEGGPYCTGQALLEDDRYEYDTVNYTVKDGTIAIGSFSFWCFKNLETITLPDSVRIISHDAFSTSFNNTLEKITSITLPRGITYIGANAFFQLYNLTDLIYKGTAAEFTCIEKSDYWHYHTGITVVHCVDRDIFVEED